MKVIQSLDEWWEARESDQLECFDDGEWKKDGGLISPWMEISGVMRLMNEGRYRWSPEQIKLVEYKRMGLANAVYRYWMPEGSFVDSTDEATGRTVKAEVITDGE